MSEYIHLIGAEDVSRAGYTMMEAADTMNRAVGNLDDALHRNRLFMDDWLARFEEILHRKEEAK